MSRFRRPSRREIDALLESAELAFSYPEVGATAQLDSPDGEKSLTPRYDVDRHTFALGTGREWFEQACDALLYWHHFEIPWLSFHGTRSHPVAPGQVVVTVARVAGLWFVNPCRVVYVESEPGRDSVAYAYGTLNSHAESGEERFRVSFDPGTGEVRYEITAFSRPALFVSRIGYPIARRIQQRFAAASAESLKRRCIRRMKRTGPSSRST